MIRQEKTGKSTPERVKEVFFVETCLIGLAVAVIGGLLMSRVTKLLNLPAVTAYLVAGLLLVLMAVGWFRLQDAKQEAYVLQNYVASLQVENKELKDTYASSYDAEEVEAIAKTMGMVPMEQVETIYLEVSVPQLKEEPTAWQAFCTFLAGLFA